MGLQKYPFLMTKKNLFRNICVCSLKDTKLHAFLRDQSVA